MASSASSSATSGTSGLSELYRKTTSTKQEVDRLLEAFETGQDRSIALQQRLGALTNEFSRLVQQLEEKIKYVDKAQKDVWQRRTTKLSDDAQHFRICLEKQLGHIYRSQIEEQQRRKLFEGKEQRERISGYLREREALKESHSLMDAITEQGRQIVDNIMGQNKNLKGVRRKMLDVTNTSGLVQSLLGVIDRRHAVDRWLVLAGMVVTLFIFYGAWKLFRG
ncbi:unnamed protein product [Vitrella brassicaformis CCMP3155]|uniref:Vesicle transport v-SNARE N-terminal domain-containing protein n=2 Tax=Vitrella brassicaformis TaxID=1169539 RepID=A0A0G4FQ86_VITBC|nr:unnamed protein product [Vitrella brassicaformis CCMP3155]|eukprot:CEM16445.1 unnamed protein product [Vitrella brassicaformis CCMP3155]